MDRKKITWIVMGLIVVAIASAAVLIITVFHGKDGDTGQKPTPTIPVDVPEGSVLVWLRSEEYFTINDEKKRMAEKYEYDEYGRCVKLERYDDEEDPRKMTAYTKYQYDETNHHTTEIEIRDAEESHPDKYVTVYDQTGAQIGWIVWSYQGEYDDYVKTTEDIWEPNAFGEKVYAASIKYYPSGSISTINWSYYDEETRTEYWRGCSFDPKEERQDKEDWRSIVENIKPDELRKTVTEYDTQGRVIAEYAVKQNEGEPEERTILREVTYAPDGTRTETSYDSYGKTVTVGDDKMLKKTFYDSDGKIDRETESVYEKLPSGGWKETMESFDGEGNLMGRYTDEYNSSDQLVLRTALVDGEDTVISRVVYDEQGHKILWERPYQIAKYEYDEYGNYVRMIFDLEDEAFPIHQVEEFVMSPVVIEREKAEYGKEFYCPVDFEP